MRVSMYFMFGFALFLSGCRTKQALPCLEITPGKAFEAKVHDTWCLADESVKITIGPILEDSRCNVKDIICVWAGRTVVELLIETNEVPFYRDTFFAVNNWQDTIAVGNYSLELSQVIPLERLDFTTDTSEYRFQMILK